jgi:hypothetical protein
LERHRRIAGLRSSLTLRLFDIGHESDLDSRRGTRGRTRPSPHARSRDSRGRASARPIRPEYDPDPRPVLVPPRKPSDRRAIASPRCVRRILDRFPGRAEELGTAREMAGVAGSPPTRSSRIHKESLRRDENSS